MSDERRPPPEPELSGPPKPSPRRPTEGAFDDEPTAPVFSSSGDSATRTPVDASVRVASEPELRVLGQFDGRAAPLETSLRAGAPFTTFVEPKRVFDAHLEPAPIEGDFPELFIEPVPFVDVHVRPLPVESAPGAERPPSAARPVLIAQLEPENGSTSDSDEAPTFVDLPDDMRWLPGKRQYSFYLAASLVTVVIVVPILFFFRDAARKPEAAARAPSAASPALETPASPRSSLHSLKPAALSRSASPRASASIHVPVAPPLAKVPE